MNLAMTAYPLARLPSSLTIDAEQQVASLGYPYSGWVRASGFVPILLAVGLAIGACSSTEPDYAAADGPYPVTSSPQASAPTATTSASPSPSTDYGDLFAKGYPKVIKKSKVPTPINAAFESTPVNTVVMVAPGVYTDDVPGVTPEEAAIDGAMSGNCAAVKKFNRKLEAAGYVPSGFTCW